MHKAHGLIQRHSHGGGVQRDGSDAPLPGFLHQQPGGFLHRCPDGTAGGEAVSPAELLAQTGTLSERMDAYEAQIIRDSYHRCGTTVAVAKELGISQATAARKISKYVTGRA